MKECSWTVFYDWAQQRVGPSAQVTESSSDRNVFEGAHNFFPYNIAILYYNMPAPRNIFLFSFACFKSVLSMKTMYYNESQIFFDGSWTSKYCEDMRDWRALDGNGSDSANNTRGMWTENVLAGCCSLNYCIVSSFPQSCPIPSTISVFLEGEQQTINLKNISQQKVARAVRPLGLSDEHKSITLLPYYNFTLYDLLLWVYRMVICLGC